MWGVRAHAAGSVPYPPTVCLGPRGLLDSFWTQPLPQVPALLWPRQMCLPLLTFLWAPQLPVSSRQAPAQTEWHFVSSGKTDGQELQRLWNLMLRWAPHKAVSSSWCL